MTKEAVISIEGSILGEDQDEISLKVNGKYAYQNNKHYIQYEEMIDSRTITNLVKIGTSQIEIIKKGASNSRMVFEKDKYTISDYETPFGNLFLGIKTIKMDLVLEENHINIGLQYTLSVDNEVVSNNEICMNIDLL